MAQNLRQGLIAGVLLSVFFVVSVTAQSDEPLRAFLVMTAVTAFAVVATTLVLRRLTRRR